jgi:proteic killer suppression protein
MKIAIAWSPCYLASMIKAFKNQGTEDIFNGRNSKEARKICPRSVWRTAARKLEQLDSVTSIEDLRIPPGNMLEALKGNRKEEYSIRINEQYRICFKWTEAGPDHVEIVDYH